MHACVGACMHACVRVCVCVHVCVVCVRVCVREFQTCTSARPVWLMWKDPKLHGCTILLTSVCGLISVICSFYSFIVNCAFIKKIK